MAFTLSPPTPAGSSALRIQLCYLWRHGRLARLAQPQLLTEWIQHRKLNDRDPRLPRLADKLLVKAEVARQIGEDWLIPTLWSGVALPDRPPVAFPFVVKSRHGSQQVRVVRDDADYAAVREASKAWMQRSYGAWLDEWLYGQIPRGLLIEPYVGTGDVLPVDYKLFVFGGEVRFVQVHLDRAGEHRWVVMDLDWQRASPADGWPDPERPATLPSMIAAASTLGADMEFVRVDLYEVNGQPLFGELTFYPGSGLEKVQPRRLDLHMGMLWAAAAAASEWGEPIARLAA
ncbi:ATP-grasp fold amidoligase family protein [Sphingomonas humi]|uniref:ATP-grasp fold amidoligase family protein n=1 Tax=Sphingomonas humi TaxID=335630 RepID=A0ABP7S6Z7_9SPHN